MILLGAPPGGGDYYLINVCETLTPSAGNVTTYATMWTHWNQRMKEHRIGIRELKSRLSQCIREVKTGATIVVTDRGRRVARIVREGNSLAERIDTLRNAGSIQWSGRRLGATHPVSRLRGKRTLAEIIVENRR